MASNDAAIAELAVQKQKAGHRSGLLAHGTETQRQKTVTE